MFRLRDFVIGFVLSLLLFGGTAVLVMYYIG